MKRRILVALKQKEVALILTALMFYEGYENWFRETPNEDIEKLKEKLNNSLIKTIKFKKIKEDNLPF